MRRLFQRVIRRLRAWRRRRRWRLRRSVVFAWMPDGTVRDVSVTPGRGYYALPCVHPEGSSVIFHGGTSQYSQIWHTDLDAGISTPLTSDAMVACSASYSADGEHITYRAYDVANHRPYTMEKAVRAFPDTGIYFGGPPKWMSIFVMKADGTDAHQLTSGRYSDIRPAFSPDGKYIVFLRRAELPEAIWTMWRVSVSGQDAPQPLITDVSVGRPWYSTDGASFFFHQREWPQYPDRDAERRRAVETAR
jgi:Tol biopolymer transport system component